MRTNQYAFVLVLQIVLLIATFAGEARLFHALRSENALPTTSEIQPIPTDTSTDDGTSTGDLLGYLAR